MDQKLHATDMRVSTFLVCFQIFNPDGLCISCLCCCNPTPFADKSPFSPPPADTFRNPAGVCCDSESNLFVADHGRHRVAMFDSNWQFQR